MRPPRARETKDQLCPWDRRQLRSGGADGCPRVGVHCLGITAPHPGESLGRKRPTLPCDRAEPRSFSLGGLATIRSCECGIVFGWPIRTESPRRTPPISPHRPMTSIRIIETVRYHGLTANVPLQSRRLRIAPATVGCKRRLAGRRPLIASSTGGSWQSTAVCSPVDRCPTPVLCATGACLWSADRQHIQEAVPLGRVGKRTR